MTDIAAHLPVDVLFLLAGAAWRFLDGMSHDTTGLPTWSRNVGTLAISLGAAWWGGLGWWSMWAGGCAAASVIIGCTRWSDWTWQAIRFGGMAAIAVLPLGVAGWPYVLACILGGLSYPVLMRFDLRLPRWWWFDGWESYARRPLGAAVLGGLAVLRLS